jgi:hypothetical protein
MTWRRRSCDAPAWVMSNGVKVANDPFTNAG